MLKVRNETLHKSLYEIYIGKLFVGKLLFMEIKCTQICVIMALLPQCPPPPGIRGGMIFVSSARQGGQLLNFKSQGGDTFRGRKMILGSQAGGKLLYHDELLIYPQNASP